MARSKKKRALIQRKHKVIGTAKKLGTRRQTPTATDAEFLLEIGTEELPYHFIPPALRAIADLAEHLFKDYRLTHGRISTFGSPRRLALSVESLSQKQTPTQREAMGPSKAIAFDEKGQPTKAAIGFAASQGVDVKDLQVRKTPKGEYVFAVKSDSGRPTIEVLSDVLPALIANLSFPKAMRWDNTGVQFARPIRWIVAIYGGKTVDLQVGSIKAGNRTFGHRFMSSTKGHQGLPVKDLKSYLSVLRSHVVIADQSERRETIQKQIASLSKSVKGKVFSDDELLEQAVYTVEYPHAILGSFNPEYLSLPKAILMTAMKEHQGFFSVMDRDGCLLPNFISVTNMKLAKMNLIRNGNERVLAARLADAKFFFDEDRKVRLADRVEKLKGVVFHKKVGTQYQRTERIVDIVRQFANRGWLKTEDGFYSVVRRAAQLSKADLLTGIVGEFPALQGIMGGEYAKHDGEPEEVCRAIAEHYLPRTADDELPKSKAGLLLSLADRLDMIFAFFRVGLIPSGSEDPLGLRRHALAVVRIILEGKVHLDLGDITIQISDIQHEDGIKASTGFNLRNVVEFILDRVRYYGRTVGGLRDDVVEAILRGETLRTETLQAQFKNLSDLYERMKALQAMTTSTEFDPLMVGFKRAHRIVEKENWKSDEINPALFQHPSEVELHKALNDANLEVPFAIAQGNYEAALNGLVGIKKPIDTFFNAVMVNTEEQELRKNRLSLLYAVDRLFMSFADFSQIVVQGA